MADADADILNEESRLVRRLDRLFRIERGGALTRRPNALGELLHGRRDAIIEDLMRADATRRALKITASAELQQAVEALASELARSRDAIDVRVRQLREDWHILRGDGVPTGMRHSLQRRLVGKG